MTIKQHGGVFGRNPSFNEVTIGGSEEVKLYHDGSDFYILEQGTGNLVLKTSRLVAESSSGASMLEAIAGGACRLYHGGNLKLNTYAGGIDITGDVRMDSGNGIDFSATAGTGTSELFDDYEEGTFTPAIEGTSVAGSGTYNSRIGYYTKIGNCVFFNLVISLASHTGSGNMRVTGLPFTSTLPAGYNSGVATFSTIGVALTYPANSVPCANVLRDNTRIDLLSLSTDGSGGATHSALALDATCAFNLTGFYYAA